MKISEIYRFLDVTAPFESAESWDNSGLIIGDLNADIKRAVVCLDVTDDVLMACDEKEASLIISHHPVIFRGIKSIASDSIYYSIIKKGINVICAHTNLDKAPGGVNDALCECLGLPFEKVNDDYANGFLNIINVENAMSCSDFARIVGKRLDTGVQFCDCKTPIKRIAVCSGAGSDFINDALLLGCDAFLTGEASYHTFLDADSSGISLFTAGHYETEIPFVSKLVKLLNNKFDSVEFYEAPYKKTVLSVT